ncbi:MAG: hypothetical protein JWQ69_3499 [Pseudomonas sp.]|nr:hypothetical protein [Pseudomonas sp.]
MSDSSQFFASSADAAVRALSLYELIFRPDWQFDYRQGVRLCNQIRSGQAQAPVMEPAQQRSALFNRAGTDVNGVSSHAKLFICSPHSCEVVKTRFFSRSFEDVNLKKELTKWQLRQVGRERKSVLADEETSNGFERIDTGPASTDACT